VSTTAQLHNNAYTILGTVIAASLLLQPFFRYMHHYRYIRTQQRSALAPLHVWYGCALLLIGILNGGLGLQLASGSLAYSRAGMITYSVLAEVAGLALLGLIVYIHVAKTKANQRAKVDAA